MKKSLFVLFFLCVVSAFFAPVKAFAQTNRVEVRFDYARQTKMASNQFAVWIEDAQGRYIKTLYATKYTAAGGWKRREQSIPLWVRQSNLAEMSATQIDAISGPTPRSGALSYTWDGTDSTGRPLPNGEYRVLVEASLYQENRVLYTATVRLGANGQTNAQAQYFGSSTAERRMLGAVTVTY